MGKGVLITVIIIAVIAVIVGFVTFGDRSQDINSGGGTPRISNSEVDIPQGDDSTENANPKINSEIVVEMSSSGFSPESVEINKGDSVTFTNVGAVGIWPASDIHPTHKSYPGSDISKCSSAEKDLIFDACKLIVPGESYTFTFNEIGTWNYHDHSRASRKGTIIVK